MNKILVTFRTKLVDIPDLLPSPEEFDPPANYRNEETIARWRSELAEKIREAAAEQPYTATFDEVHLLDAATRRYDIYRAAAGEKPLSVRVWEWLKSSGYDSAWPHSLLPPDRESVQAILVGFDIKLFMKIFGIECSLPRTWYPDSDSVKVKREVPLGLWYGNYAYKDLTDIVMPGECRYLSWRTVLQARNLHKKFEGWNGPHKDPGRDMLVAAELATQIGLLEADAE